MEDKSHTGTTAHRSQPNLGQYINKIDSTARNHCHNCGQSPPDTHHIFDCPSKPTTMTVESLWTTPTETAKHLNIYILNAQVVLSAATIRLKLDFEADVIDFTELLIDEISLDDHFSAAVH